MLIIPGMMRNTRGGRPRVLPSPPKPPLASTRVLQVAVLPAGGLLVVGRSRVVDRSVPVTCKNPVK